MANNITLRCTMFTTLRLLDYKMQWKAKSVINIQYSLFCFWWTQATIKHVRSFLLSHGTFQRWVYLLAPFWIGVHSNDNDVQVFLSNVSAGLYSTEVVLWFFWWWVPQGNLSHVFSQVWTWVSLVISVHADPGSLSLDNIINMYCELTYDTVLR